MQADRIGPSVLKWMSSQLRRGVPHSPVNPLIEGAYTPVPAEQTSTSMRVTGALPVELNGTFVRIGPNPIRVPNPGAHHWFAGEGMVHGVRLREGRADWFGSRWVKTDGVSKWLGEPPLPGRRNGVAEVVNINVIRHAGKLWALTEAGPLPIELDGELRSVRHSFFGLPKKAAFSAHPHLDPADGSLHAVCYEGGPGKAARYVALAADGTLSRDVAIPLPRNTMIHDCAITRSSVVVLDLPVKFSGREFWRGAQVPYGWDGKCQARVGLLSRNGAASAMRWWNLAPCFVYHTCNAHDLDDGGVVLDVIVHGSTFDGAPLGDKRPLSFERWTLDPDASEVRRSVWSDLEQEFPRFDERRTTRPHRYAYMVGFRPGSRDAQPLYKHDLTRGTVARHDFGAGRIPGEAVFVPRSDSAAEDDGWLLTYVYDLGSNTSELVVLDAADVAAAPRASVHLPAPVPMGLHSNWIAH